jgi:integrase
MEKLLEFHPKPLRAQVEIELPAYAGLRAGEVVTVRVEDIDFTDQVLFALDSKKHKYRAVPLDPVLAMHLEELIRVQKMTCGYILRRISKRGRPSRIPARTIEPQTVWKTFLKYDRLLGLPELTPRDARRYFAWMHYHVLEPRLTSLEIKTLLGHEHLSSTEHYLDMIDFDVTKDRFLEQCRDRLTLKTQVEAIIRWGKRACAHAQPHRLSSEIFT